MASTEPSTGPSRDSARGARGHRAAREELVDPLGGLERFLHRRDQRHAHETAARHGAVRLARDVAARQYGDLRLREELAGERLVVAPGLRIAGAGAHVGP